MKGITAITVAVSGFWRISERIRILSEIVYRLVQQTTSHYSSRRLWYTIKAEHMRFTPAQIERFARSSFIAEVQRLVTISQFAHQLDNRVGRIIECAEI